MSKNSDIIEKFQNCTYAAFEGDNRTQYRRHPVTVSYTMVIKLTNRIVFFLICRQFYSLRTSQLQYLPYLKPTLSLFSLYSDDAPALCLSVSSNGKSGPQSEHLDINCTLDTTKTELETVTSLTLLGSRPSEDNEEFDQLAELEIWTNSPMMVSLGNGTVFCNVLSLLCFVLSFSKMHIPL